MANTPVTIGLRNSPYTQTTFDGLVRMKTWSCNYHTTLARRSLETLMDYQLQQGILDHTLNIDELFVPQTLGL